MSDFTLVLGPAWSRFSKKVLGADDIQAADELPRLLEFEDGDIVNLDDLLDMLTRLRSQPNTCVIRGQLLPDVVQPCRRLTKPRVEDGVEYAATIIETPRRWLMVDFDSLPEPEGVDFAAEPERCAIYLRAQLPAEFRGAACVWQATGSAGFKPGIRLHLWFLLDRAIDGDACKAWLSHSTAEVDRRVYGAVQPHYTADPELHVPDPMSARIGQLRGAQYVRVPDPIPEDLRLKKKTIAIVSDTRELDPFLRSALQKWERDHSWDTPDLSTRFECPACGSSDGCAVLPDGKLFCHGDKHSRNAPNIGHPANNGFVMHRFEAQERLEWTQVVPRLQELGYYPGIPKRPSQVAQVDQVVDEMTAVVEGRELNLGRAKRARKELKEAQEHVRLDPSALERLTFEFARRYASEIAPDAIRDAFLRANSTSKRPSAAMLDVDARDAIERALSKAEAEPWTDPPSALARDMFGKPIACLANVVKILHLSEFTNVLAWDIRARRKLVTAPPPWLADDGTQYPRQLDDSDYPAMAVMLADHFDYPHAGVGHLAEATALACTANSVDPVLEYFEALPPFDGDLDDARAVAGCWLTEFAGAPDDAYTRAVAMRALIAAVARTYVPGCKHREVLTMLGPQNKGKSALLAALCRDPEWFMDDFVPGRADSAQSMLGTLIIEIAELDKLVATDRHGELKSFVSTNTDKYRRPYGREFERVPRRGVIMASANPSQLFRDPTGNTRYNVVQVADEIDFNGAAAAREELWSAARMLFKSGEPWWLQAGEKEEAARRQDAAREVSDAEEFLRELIDNPLRPGALLGHIDPTQRVDGRWVWFTSQQLVDYLKICGVTRNLFRQISQSMTSLGWVRVRHVGDDNKNGPRGWCEASTTGRKPHLPT